MYRSSPLRSIEVGQAKILTVKNAHDYTYGKPPVGINMCLIYIYIYTYIQYIYTYIHMSQLSNHQSPFFRIFFPKEWHGSQKSQSKIWKKPATIEVLEGLPQYLQNELRSWAWLPSQDSSDHQVDITIFNRESRTKPFFVTIASWGATPKLEVPSAQILGWDPFLLPMHKASHTQQFLEPFLVMLLWLIKLTLFTIHCQVLKKHIYIVTYYCTNLPLYIYQYPNTCIFLFATLVHYA